MEKTTRIKIAITYSLFVLAIAISCLLAAIVLDDSYNTIIVGISGTLFISAVMLSYWALFADTLGI